MKSFKQDRKNSIPMIGRPSLRITYHTPFVNLHAILETDDYGVPKAYVRQEMDLFGILGCIADVIDKTK